MVGRWNFLLGMAYLYTGAILVSERVCDMCVSPHFLGFAKPRLPQVLISWMAGIIQIWSVFQMARLSTKMPEAVTIRGTFRNNTKSALSGWVLGMNLQWLPLDALDFCCFFSVWIVCSEEWRGFFLPKGHVVCLLASWCLKVHCKFKTDCWLKDP